MNNIPSDIYADKFPISVKGIIEINKKIVLLKNERNEWELPGGKIDHGENATECLIREIKEELNIDVDIAEIIDTWMYNINDKVDVFIVTYLCSTKRNYDFGELQISHEHKELGFFDLMEIEKINIPDGYRRSIYKTFINEK